MALASESLAKAGGGRFRVAGGRGAVRGCRQPAAAAGLCAALYRGAAATGQRLAPTLPRQPVYAAERGRGGGAGRAGRAGTVGARRRRERKRSLPERKL